MINNITINGITYELIDNPDKLTLSCDKCDLLSFCQQDGCESFWPGGTAWSVAG